MKAKRLKLILSCILLFNISVSQNANAFVEAVLGIPPEQNNNLAFNLPELKSTEIIISKDQFVISYNKEHRSPNWVAWKLEPNNIGKSGRSNNFSIDLDLENYLNQSGYTKPAVDPSEYRGSCYDRGHQIPSADRSDTVSNNETTFLMSNMIPQTAYLNRVIWEHLEQYSRDLVQKQNKKLYIIAGPIYNQDYGSIGPNKDIPVPSMEFKIIYVLEANQSAKDINSTTPTIAVIMPNTLQDGTLPTLSNACKLFVLNSSDKSDWEKYRATVNDIEKLSGIHFLQ